MADSSASAILIIRPVERVQLNETGNRKRMSEGGATSIGRLLEANLIIGSLRWRQQRMTERRVGCRVENLCKRLTITRNCGQQVNGNGSGNGSGE